MIEFIIFFIGIFLGLTIFAIFGANKDLVATEIDRDFYKRLYEETKEKLAQYEDTGLVPDEIHKLNDFEQSQIATLLKEKAILLKEHFELRKERNYWEREAKRWASELGEQKIERGKYGEINDKS